MRKTINRTDSIHTFWQKSQTVGFLLKTPSTVYRIYKLNLSSHRLYFLSSVANSKTTIAHFDTRFIFTNAHHTRFTMKIEEDLEHLNYLLAKRSQEAGKIYDYCVTFLTSQGKWSYKCSLGEFKISRILSAL